MKEPWQVYYDLFVEHAKRDDLSAADPDDYSPGVGRGIGVAYWATLESLTGPPASMHHAKASELVATVFLVQVVDWYRNDPTHDFSALRRRLKDEYTTWCLDQR